MALVYSMPVSYLGTPRGFPGGQLSAVKNEPDCDYLPTDPSLHFRSFPMTGHVEDSKFPLLRTDKAVLSSASDRQLTSWTTKHPRNWSSEEVLDWLYFVVEEEHLDGARVHGEAYQSCDGAMLCSWKREDFRRADPEYGGKLFDVFRSLVSNVSFLEPRDGVDQLNLDNFNWYSNSCSNRFNKNLSDSIVDRRDDSSSNSGSNSNGNNGRSLVVLYDTDTDVKVNLNGLGLYPISTDFEPFPSSSSSSLSSNPHPSSSSCCSSSSSSSSTSSLWSSCVSRLQAATSFTSPPPLSPSAIPNFLSFSPPTPPASVSGMSVRSSSSPPSSSLPSQPYSSALSTPPMTSATSSSSSSSSSSTSALLTPFTKPFTSHAPSCAAPPSTSSSSHEAMDSGYASDDSMSASFMPPFPSSSPDAMFTDDVACVGAFSSDVIFSGRDEVKKLKKSKNSHPTTKGNHLWEFMRDLLRDPSTNPKLLKWEDKENGVFRFVQSEAVAQLWGKKKNNPLMTYEKLSRAMRFCRTAGYFESVPKNGKFPKKLCFMFGAKAHGWMD